MKRAKLFEEAERNAAKELRILPQREDWENAEAVHDELRGAILRNELPAAMILKPVHLPKQLGGCRTPRGGASPPAQQEGPREREYRQRKPGAARSVGGPERLH